jgi:hypothetical protein
MIRGLWDIRLEKLCYPVLSSRQVINNLPVKVARTDFIGRHRLSLRLHSNSSSTKLLALTAYTASPECLSNLIHVSL